MEKNLQKLKQSVPGEELQTSQTRILGLKCASMFLNGYENRLSFHLYTSVLTQNLWKFGGIFENLQRNSFKSDNLG